MIRGDAGLEEVVVCVVAPDLEKVDTVMVRMVEEAGAEEATLPGAIVVLNTSFSTAVTFEFDSCLFLEEEEFEEVS